MSEVRDLGAGLATALGKNSAGAYVRASDASCVTKLTFFGRVAASGAVTPYPLRAPITERVYNVKDFGAVGDGHIVAGVVVGTDDSAAIQACIAAIRRDCAANAGLGNAQATMYFPHGIYLCSSTLDFSTVAYYSQYYPGVTIAGDGGSLSQEEPASSAIVYTGSSGNAIAARSTVGFTIRDIAVLYNSTTYTGTLIDFGHGVTAADTQCATLANCSIGFAYRPSSGLGRAAKLISLDRAIFSVIDNCCIRDGRIGIHGTMDGYSNQVTIQRCTFQALSFAAIANAGDAWSVLGCAFEGPFLTRLYGDDRTGAQVAAFVVEGCWTGDTGNWSPWIDVGNSILLAASIRGNLFATSIANPAASSLGTFTFNAANCTITRPSGSWITDGFDANVEFDIVGTANNDGRYMVSLPPSATVLQCLQASFVNETVACSLSNAYPAGSTKDSIRLGGSRGVDISANNIGTIDFRNGYGPQSCSAIHVHGNALSSTDTTGSPLFRGLWQATSDTFADVVIEGNSSIYQNTPGQSWISGHIITVPEKTTKPTVTCASGATVSLSGSAYTGSNDTCGRITLVVSPSTTAGEQVRLTFQRAYNYVAYDDPCVQLTPANAAAAALTKIHASAIGTSGAYFIISSGADLPAGTYIWNYLVMQ